MRKYIFKRIVSGLFIIWAVATTVFFGLRALPGGPIEAMLGQRATPELVRQMRREAGLNRPIWVQYADWMTDFITMDFGTSIITGEKISVIVFSSAPKTLSIAMVGIVVGLAIALPAGVISAVYQDSPLDYVATIAAFLGLSMPAFFIGILLALVFGVWFNLLPVFGYTPISKGVIPWLKSVILPGIAVGLPYSAVIMRMMRSSVLEVLGQQYMKTARSKGVAYRRRLFKHAILNAMIPVVTVAGIQIALVIIGSVTVELVFGIEGIGRLLVKSMLIRGYKITQVVIVLTAAVMVFTNLTVDIIYTLIDPRIRYGET